MQGTKLHMKHPDGLLASFIINNAKFGQLRYAESMRYYLLGFNLNMLCLLAISVAEVEADPARNDYAEPLRFTSRTNCNSFDGSRTGLSRLEMINCLELWFVSKLNSISC
jgi:hypothetical protein